MMNFSKPTRWIAGLLLALSVCGPISLAWAQSNALPVQGPVDGIGAALDVNVLSGGGGGCVTQCTSPWVVQQTPNFTLPVTYSAFQGTVVPGGVVGMVQSVPQIISNQDGRLYSETGIGPSGQNSQGVPGSVVATESQDTGNVFALNPPTAIQDGAGNVSEGRQILSSIGYLYKGTPSTNGYERPRTPAIFKTVTAAVAGNTVAWTPTAGFKFRLMRYQIIVTDNATQAAPGTLTISLNDAGAALNQVHPVFVPAVALLNSGSLYTSPWIDLGNGQLSAAVNNALNVNLSAALTAGQVQVNLCGTEE